MQQVTQHIVKLLYKHNCVVVPGLGGFVANYQPAKVHPTSFIFNSPSKSVAFNVHLSTNDGLLADAIAHEEGISRMEAETMILKFSDMVHTALSEQKPVKLAGIGRLTMDVEGQIRFLPDNAQNFLLQSYGLPSFTAQPIARERVNEPEPAKPVQQIKVKKKRKSSDALLPIAAVLLIAMTVMQIFVQKNMSGFDYAEILGLRKLDPRYSLELERYKPITYSINNSITYFRTTMPVPVDSTTLEAVTPGATPTISQPATSTSKFFVSAGSFYSAAQAQKVVDRIAEKGFQGYVKPYGKYQVAAVDIPDSENSTTFRKAFSEATGIKGAWVGKN